MCRYVTGSGVQCNIAVFKYCRFHASIREREKAAIETPAWAREIQPTIVDSDYPLDIFPKEQYHLYREWQHVNEIMNNLHRGIMDEDYFETFSESDPYISELSDDDDMYEDY